MIKNGSDRMFDITDSITIVNDGFTDGWWLV